MVKKVTARTELVSVLPTKGFNFPSLRRGLRFHQWAKNALVFVPLVLGGKVHDSTAWLHALGGFVALSVLASATYVLNDLWDLTEDRRHWSKKNRPLASGDLSIATGIGLIAGGGLASFLLAALMRRELRRNARALSRHQSRLFVSAETRTDRRRFHSGRAFFDASGARRGRHRHRVFAVAVCFLHVLILVAVDGEASDRNHAHGRAWARRNARPRLSRRATRH